MIATIEEKQQELAEPCRAYAVRRLELFGSAATETDFDPASSDLDFLVEFAPDTDLGPWLRHYFEFHAALRQLFGRPVDLVMASALKNPHFIREVNRSRKLIHAGNDP